MIEPAQYWRANKTWSSLLGQKGVVVASTFIRVAAPEFSSQVPYSYAIVKFANSQHELLGVGHEQLEAGDQVEAVFRKMGSSSKSGLINYGIKVKKV